MLNRNIFYSNDTNTFVKANTHVRTSILQLKKNDLFVGRISSMRINGHFPDAHCLLLFFLVRRRSIDRTETSQIDIKIFSPNEN